jgi:hypothetical protein
MTTTTVQPDKTAIESALIAALTTAGETLGSSRVSLILDDHGWLPEPNHDDCAEPHDQDRLDAAARLVHAKHDQFSWRHCSRDMCRALRDV